MFVKLALDENGNVKVTEGDNPKPIYINDKGEEVAVDPPAMYQKILDLGTESKNGREALETLTTKFATLDDVENVEEWVTAAKKAVEQVENFNDKDWLEVKKVDAMKSQMKEVHDKELGQIKVQFEGTINEQKDTIVRKDGQIRKLMVSNRFANSPLFTGATPKTNLSPDVAESFFGHHFKVEEKDGGEPIVRAYFGTGDAVYSASPERVGELANFDEAIQIIFDAYPNRDQYIRSKGKGSGAGGGGGGGEDESDIGILNQQYKEAQAAKNTAQMIVIKNRITDIQMKSRSKAA